ncbi:C40 family peptidase [Capnocytophaga sp. ARDL2]|uniref:C40 family peptidase n=1 Tax=Capnocytophaga sp. ARDL2 TaxID=3238809 RepID=UPI0035563D4B
MKKIIAFIVLSIFLVQCKSREDWRIKYNVEKNKANNKTKNSKNITKSSAKASATKVDLDNMDTFIQNKQLKDLVLEWYYTPYKLGGTTKNGVDCSGFTQVVYEEIYNKKLPRTSSDMSKLIKRVYVKDLKEGDLVFFSFNNSDKINHVGVYLKDNKFVHASTKKGVIISDLTEPWYGNYLTKCGPVINES